MSEILFLGGPAGSGKSFFASQYLASRGWRHLDVDLYPKDGINEHNLRAEWDAFYLRCNPKPLHDELLARAGGAPGIVLTFPSKLVFSAQHLRAAAGGFRIAYLYGHPAHCLRSFLDRERQSGRGLTAAHWDRNSAAVFGNLAVSLQQPFLIPAFNPDGSHRDPQLIYDDIIRTNPAVPS